MPGSTARPRAAAPARPGPAPSAGPARPVPPASGIPRATPAPGPSRPSVLRPTPIAPVPAQAPVPRPTPASRERLGDDFDRPPELAPGARFGPYRIVRQVGRGSMGAVYEATYQAETAPQRVTLRVLPRDWNTAVGADWFRAACHLVAGLDHPWIARLIDGGVAEDGTPYVAMEHVVGEEIDAWCRGRDLDVTERIKLVLRACTALEYAHQRLVVHRSVSPKNILVTADGQPKLMNCGVARLLFGRPDTGEGLARTGQSLFTPEYTSPEQVRGELMTAATDIYSLGVLLYVLLTDHPPYALHDLPPPQMKQVICEREPELPSQVVPTAAAPPAGERTRRDRHEVAAQGPAHALPFRHGPRRRSARVARRPPGVGVSRQPVASCSQDDAPSPAADGGGGRPGRGPRGERRRVRLAGLRPARGPRQGRGPAAGVAPVFAVAAGRPARRRSGRCPDRQRCAGRCSAGWSSIWTASRGMPGPIPPSRSNSLTGIAASRRCRPPRRARPRGAGGRGQESGRRRRGRRARACRRPALTGRRDPLVAACGDLAAIRADVGRARRRRPRRRAPPRPRGHAGARPFP